MINKQIHITSISKAISNGKIYGKLNLKAVELYSLYKDSIEYAQEMSDSGSTQFEDYIVYLKNEASKLVYKYPKEICNYKVVVPNNPVGINGPIVNTAPTASNKVIDILDKEIYTFTLGDFISDYSDVQNHGWKFLMIYSNSNIGVDGNIRYSDGVITNMLTINIENLPLTTELNLYYDRINLNVFSGDIFNFRVSDNPVNYLYSPIYTMTINASLPVVLSSNQPPSDIGDITLYTGNRVTTVLTLAMFTTNLTPPYNDPEGDLIDAVKIIDISNANQGIYYYNGVPIVEEQIITREDIIVGLFTHVGPDVDTVTSDVFEFQVRDEGSKMWIE